MSRTGGDVTANAPEDRFRALAEPFLVPPVVTRLVVVSVVVTIVMWPSMRIARAGS
jgi:hypothetical protein